MSILAERYASSVMKQIWSPHAKILSERNLWIAVMKAQAQLGFEIPASAIADYEKVKEQIDLASIDRREKELRHDVKARIEEFNALAGHQYIHIGMTSRDLTENIEAFQIISALKLVQSKTITVLARLAEKTAEYKALPMVGRSHNVPAQVTTLGKRFATVAEELLFAYSRLENLISTFPIRGLKGPVGTAQDAKDVMGENYKKLEQTITESLGFANTLDSTGQIYPRSFDYDVITTLVQLSAAPANLATSIRLMAGHDLVSEGFKAGQVGSSAMPHKMNTRSCERINGFAAILKGYATMIGEISGNQWNEGDVSDSVVRRVAIADAFYAIDGMLETTLTVLKEFGVFPANIEKELQQNLPFLATTKILMAAVKAGMGREDAHEVIKEISTTVANKQRQGESASLIESLAADNRLPLSQSDLLSLISQPLDFAGLAQEQCDAVIAKIKAITTAHPAAQGYQPEQIR
ncbi:MAG: adenylosuccinate lyase [Candidatus Nanopelagicaceae bacterium]|nr:adenylosuccinate lyase [Candidatus Nanopelagicaceae bacterium]